MRTLAELVGVPTGTTLTAEDCVLDAIYQLGDAVRAAKDLPIQPVEIPLREPVQEAIVEFQQTRLSEPVVPPARRTVTDFLNSAPAVTPVNESQAPSYLLPRRYTQAGSMLENNLRVIAPESAAPLESALNVDSDPDVLTEVTGTVGNSETMENEIGSFMDRLEAMHINTKNTPKPEYVGAHRDQESRATNTRGYKARHAYRTRFTKLSERMNVFSKLRNIEWSGFLPHRATRKLGALAIEELVEHDEHEKERFTPFSTLLDEHTDAHYAERQEADMAEAPQSQSDAPLKLRQIQLPTQAEAEAYLKSILSEAA